MSLTLKILSRLLFNCLICISVLLISFSFTIRAQDLQFKTITVNDGLTQHDVSCILQDSYGFIWIGTYDGLNRYDGYTIQNYFHVTEDENSLSSNRIKCLFEDSQKTIWIGTDGSGINYYSLIKEKFERVETPENYQTVQDIIETENGEIFIATNNGVLQIIKNDKGYRTEIMQFPFNGLFVNDIEIVDNKITATYC